MVTSPSKRFDGDTLAERAIPSDVAGDPDEQETVTGRPNDKAPENSTFASRKRIGEAENKSVRKKAATKRR